MYISGVGGSPDELIAGDDDVVRGALGRELDRLRAAAAHEALGLPAGADPAEVRARFLEITRRYHPNRFARRPPDVLRRANEVFLLYRRAYEQARLPPGEAPAPPGRPPRAVSERIEKLDRLSPPSQPSLAVDAALARRRRTRSHPGFAASTAGATPPPAKVSAAELAERAHRQEAEQRERLRAALGEIRAGHLAGAQQALRALLAERPQDRAVRCALHYAIGREHHAAGRSAEARAEYERVLGWDPGHQEARSSLALLSEPEPAGRGGGGILSRWFKK